MLFLLRNLLGFLRGLFSRCLVVRLFGFDLALLKILLFLAQVAGRLLAQHLLEAVRIGVGLLVGFGLLAERHLLDGEERRLGFGSDEAASHLSLQQRSL